MPIHDIVGLTELPNIHTPLTSPSLANWTVGDFVSQFGDKLIHKIMVQA